MLPVPELRLRLCSSKSWLEPPPLPTFLLSAIEPSAFELPFGGNDVPAVRVATAPAVPVSPPEGRRMSDVPEGGKHRSLT